MGAVPALTSLHVLCPCPQTCLDLTLVYMGSPEHGQEVEVSTALLQEEGEIPGNPNKGGIFLTGRLWGKCWEFRGLEQDRAMKGTIG